MNRGLCYLVCASLLRPNLENFRRRRAIFTRLHTMSTCGSDMGEGMGRKKTLRVSRRFEPLHLPFSTSRRSMPDYSDSGSGDAIAFQFICYDHAQGAQFRGARAAYVMLRIVLKLPPVFYVMVLWLAFIAVLVWVACPRKLSWPSRPRPPRPAGEAPLRECPARQAAT